MNIKIAVFIGMFILTSPVIALTVQQEHYQEQISSSNFRKVQNAFENIVSNHESNNEVLDLAAQLLIEHLPFQREREEDTLAWACRALGESKNTRYVELLSKIINGNSSQKIKKHALNALKKTQSSSQASSFVAGSINLIALNKHYQSQQKYTPTERNILNIGNKNLFEIKLLSEQIYRGQSVTTLTSDLLAQFLLENSSSATNQNSDTLAWVCKALTKVNSSRYKSILQDIINTTDSRRIRSHCKKAIKSLNNLEPVINYKLNDININQQVKLVTKS